MELFTERLRLRRWVAADAVPFAALNADPEVMEFLPAALSRGQSDAFIARIEECFSTRGYGLWAVEAPTGFIGYTGLWPVPGEVPFAPAVEVGWRLARSAWGQGYATEAARAALAYGFSELGLAEVVSFTAVGNVRSRAVMERLGMSYDGTFEHPALPAGHRLREHVLYRLTSERHGPSA